MAVISPPPTIHCKHPSVIPISPPIPYQRPLSLHPVFTIILLPSPISFEITHPFRPFVPVNPSLIAPRVVCVLALPGEGTQVSTLSLIQATLTMDWGSIPYLCLLLTPFAHTSIPISHLTVCLCVCVLYSNTDPISLSIGLHYLQSFRPPPSSIIPLPGLGVRPPRPQVV